MKINITKKEYETLVEILEIADWVLHAHEIEKSEDNQPFQEFKQKIFALAKDFGYDQLIKYEKQLQEYFLTRELEDTSPGMAFIEKFENESFWENLIDRLAQRDLIRELGEEKVISLEPLDRMEKEDPLREKYEEEFEVHGIDRLEIVP